MTGARLNVGLDASRAEAALRGLARLGLQPRDMLAAIGVGLAENVRNRIDEEKAPDGSAWEPLLPDYAAIKRGPGILRESGMSGGLQGSIISDATDDEVAVGSNRIYAAVHQFGATIRPVRAKALRFRLASGVVLAQSVEIPARPYLGISDEDQETVMDVIDAFAQAALTP